MATKPPKREYSKYLPLFQVYDDPAKNHNDDRPEFFMSILLELYDIIKTGKAEKTPELSSLIEEDKSILNVDTFDNIIKLFLNYVNNKYGERDQQIINSNIDSSLLERIHNIITNQSPRQQQSDQLQRQPLAPLRRQQSAQLQQQQSVPLQRQQSAQLPRQLVPQLPQLSASRRPSAQLQQSQRSSVHQPQQPQQSQRDNQPNVQYPDGGPDQGGDQNQDGDPDQGGDQNQDGGPDQGGEQNQGGGAAQQKVIAEQQNAISDIRQQTDDDFAWQIWVYIIQLLLHIKNKRDLDLKSLIDSILQDSDDPLNYFFIKVEKITDIDNILKLQNFKLIIDFYIFAYKLQHPKVVTPDKALQYQALQQVSFRRFNINNIKYTQKVWSRPKSPFVPPGTVDFDVMDNSVEKQKRFFRVDEYNYLLEWNDTKNDWEKMDITKIPENCFGTYVNTTPYKCSKYLIDCLHDNSPDSIKKCKEFLYDPDFYKIATEELKHIDLGVVHYTLKNLQFNSVKQGDLVKYQYFNDWIEDLEKSEKLTTDEKEKIKNNTHLQEYLDALVKKANLNLTISWQSKLQPGKDSENYANKIKKEYSTVPSTVPSTDKKTANYRITLWGGSGEPTPSELYNSILDFQSLIDDASYHNDRFKQIISQQGGSSNTIKYSTIEDIYKFLVKEQKDGAQLTPRSNYRLSTHITQIYSFITKALQTKGVSLEKGDYDQFEKKIHELAEMENKLIDKFITLAKITHALLNDDPKTFDLKKKGNVSYTKDMLKVNELLTDTTNLQGRINKKTERLQKAIIYVTSSLFPMRGLIPAVPLP